MTRPISVLVTGVGGGTIGEQVCKALRMGRHRYEIITTNVRSAPLAVFKAEHHAVLPPVSDDNYFEAMLALVNKYKVQFLIPGSEPELIKLSQCRDLFAHLDTKILINADHVIATCIDKRRTFEHLATHNFRVPATFEVNSTTELEKITSGFPYIIKPAQGGGGSAATLLAQDKTELNIFVDYLLRYGYRVLVQEYIGRAEDEYTVGVLHNPDGKLLGSVVLRRHILSGLSNRLRISNQTGRSELGNVLAISSGISQGRIVDFPPVRLQAEAIAQAFNSVGPLNIQGRWDGEQFVPFEINPRFSGTTPMRAMAGFNELELLINYYLYPDQPQIPPGVRCGEFIRGLVEFFTPDDESLEKAIKL